MIEALFGMVPGVPDLIELSTASGAGGNTQVTLQPDAGTIYIPLLIMSYQDDAARVMDWCLYETAGAIVWTGTVNANTYTYFYEDCHIPFPLTLTHERYLYMLCIAMAASKNLYLKAWVHKITGVATG